MMAPGVASSLRTLSVCAMYHVVYDVIPCYMT